MLSKQSEHRVDVAVVLFCILQEVLTDKEEYENATRLTDEDAMLFDPAFRSLFDDIDFPDVIRSNPCGDNDCCGWHQICAQNVLNRMNGDITGYYESDGSLNTEFLRKLMRNVFEEIAAHKGIQPTTVADSCTRGFNGINLDDFFKLFISSFNMMNPLRIAIENDIPASETVNDINSYIKSLGYPCVEGWYYR